MNVNGSLMVFLLAFTASLNFHAECSSAVKHQERAQGKFHNVYC